MKLLTVNNPKIAKGAKLGYHSAVLHLAPFKVAGINVCPMAELAGCIAGCLNTAGRGGIAAGAATFEHNGFTLPDNVIQKARIARTRSYAEDREAFMLQLADEIRRVVRQAERLGLRPAIRLNGTSDIQWELIPFAGEANIFEAFPDVQFYDYTKIAKRFERPLPANYHLSLSYSAATPRYKAMCDKAAATGRVNVVIVVRNDEVKQRLMDTVGSQRRPGCVVDGDDHDLRFLDPIGAWVYLKAKGKARKDTSGFVID